MKSVLADQYDRLALALLAMFSEAGFVCVVKALLAQISMTEGHPRLLSWIISALQFVCLILFLSYLYEY